MRFGCWLSSVTISPARAGVMSGVGVSNTDDRKIAVVRQQLLHLRDGLGMQVSCKVAVLCRIPVVSRKIMTGSLVGRATRRSPILILRIVEAELHALLAALLGQFADRIALKGWG